MSALNVWKWNWQTFYAFWLPFLWHCLLWGSWSFCFLIGLIVIGKSWVPAVQGLSAGLLLFFLLCLHSLVFTLVHLAQHSCTSDSALSLWGRKGWPIKILAQPCESILLEELGHQTSFIFSTNIYLSPYSVPGPEPDIRKTEMKITLTLPCLWHTVWPSVLSRSIPFTNMKLKECRDVICKGTWSSQIVNLVYAGYANPLHICAFC